jgi:hypothetical protein
MKAIFVKFLVIVCSINHALSQGLVLNPDNTFAVCPGIWTIYTVTNSSFAPCTYYWNVTNGEIQGGILIGNRSSFTGGNLIQIKWFDTTNRGNVSVSADCNPSSGNGSDSFPISILSINGINPGELSGNNQVDVNNTANQTFTVPPIQFPNVGSGENPRYVNGYEWAVPSGWTIVSGSNTNTITVKPDNCSGGSISVRGKSTICPQQVFYSNWNSKIIFRTLSTPGEISGNEIAICSDNSVKNYSISPVTGASSYTWSLPSGWIGASNTTLIDVIPNGLNGGTISVKAVGCNIQSGSSSKTILLNLFDSENPPLITGISPVCHTGRTFTLSNFPQNSSINWNQSSNLTYISGQGTISYNVRAQSASTTGSGWVEATISTPCGTIPAIINTIWVGKPFNFLVEGPTLVTAGSYNNYNAKIWNHQPTFSEQGVGPNDFSWSFPWEPTNAGWDCTGCSGEHIILIAGNLSTLITSHVENI